jgi:hypothetical protein
MTDDTQKMPDPQRTIPLGEPGQAAAPGGEPVAAPDERPDDRPVAPPGTKEGGYPDGPPAHHRQPKK